MKKTLYVAAREFMATVMTKGFVFGVLITPALIAVVIYFMPRMMNRTPPAIEGRVAILDRTGVVADRLGEHLTPQAFAERRREDRRRVEARTPAAVRREVERSPAGKAAMEQSLDAALGRLPRIELEALPPASDLDQAKAPLVSPADAAAVAGQRLALVVVHGDAVRPRQGGGYGSYDLFVKSKLDDRLVDHLQDALRDAIVAARLEEAGMDPARAEGLTEVERPTSTTVTATGEQETNELLNVLLPAVFMGLLLVSVITSGQYLLTSTVEEKSTRVVEVLLSAVSARELMTGKIIGQMGVGLVVLGLYAGLGILGLISFAAIGLLDPMLIVYLLIFFVLAYFSIAAMMAAIGAAVNEMREAQSLMTPVMLVIMVPWILWMPISRDPNSLLAVVLSYVPPLSNFVMLLRLTSSSPPPAWQAWLAIVVGLAGVYVLLWAAAKVFRVGLLMFGKPPSMRTLVRWARMS
ncbi:MAG TPA: ABC transporter permease [Vicinamibacterales bacterium]|nr:ABC transporter permease [Vicinamibacterales bacterium]